MAQLQVMAAVQLVLLRMDIIALEVQVHVSHIEVMEKEQGPNYEMMEWLVELLDANQTAQEL